MEKGRGRRTDGLMSGSMEEKGVGKKGQKPVMMDRCVGTKSDTVRGGKRPHVSGVTL